MWLAEWDTQKIEMKAKWLICMDGNIRVQKDQRENDWYRRHRNSKNGINWVSK